MAIIAETDLPKIYTEVDRDGNSAGNWFYFNGQTDFTEALQVGTDKIVTELRKQGKNVWKEDPGEPGKYKSFIAKEENLLDTEPIKEIAVDFAIAFINHQHWLKSDGDPDNKFYLEYKSRESSAIEKLHLIPFTFDSDGDAIIDDEENLNTKMYSVKISR